MDVALRWLAASALVLGACRSTEPRSPRSESPGSAAGARALTLFRGGTIRLDSSSAPVEALLVADGVVVAAGREAEVSERARGAAIVELGGGCAVPGLVDAHGHLPGLALFRENVDLVGVASYEELVARIAAVAQERPTGTWIRGRGWDQSRWPENAFPHHARLSAAVPDHPVFLERVDGHAALANALALERVGLSSARAIEGGSMFLDERGAPTGVLLDRAADAVEDAIPAPDHAALLRGLLLAQEECLRHGLTAVHDMGLEPDEIAALEALEQSGRLKLRVVAYLWGNDGLPPELLADRPTAHDRDPASRLRIVGVKFLFDGAVGSRGAALLEPYTDDPQNSGLLHLAPQTYEALVALALARGLQPATHAIGDRANRIVLDVYERALTRDPRVAELRPRIEHAQVVAPEDRRRFERLGVIPSMQPTHATSDMRWAEARLGPERSQGAYAWKQLASVRSPLAFGSDFPVERVSPLEGIYAARTRADRDGFPAGGWHPSEILGASEALAGFTSGAAFAAREETRRGKLLPGYFADMTVLDVDPVACEPAVLLNARVLATVVEGEVVYAAPPAPGSP